MGKKRRRDPKHVRNVVITCVCLAVALIGIVGYLVFDGYTKSYSLIFEGEKVPVAEYKLYLLEQKITYEYYFGTDVWDIKDGETDYATMAKDRAMESLVYVKTAARKGSQLGLAFNEEDQKAAEDLIDSIKSSSSIGDARLKEIGLTDKELERFSQDAVMLDKVIAETTKDFTIDEEEFNTYFDDYLKNNVSAYTTVNVNYVVTDSQEKADLAKTKFESGAEPKEVVKEYSTAYDEEDTDEFKSVSSLYLPADVTSQLYELSEGQISDVVENDGQYYVFKIHSIEKPTEEELLNTQRESFTEDKKSEFFQGEIDKWMSELQYEKNQKAVDAVNIKDM